MNDSTTNSTAAAETIGWASLRIGATYRLVRFLDLVMQGLAWAASKVSRVSDAGAFWYPNEAGFLDAWRRVDVDGSGSVVLRLGRMELMADYRAPRARLMA